MGGWEFCECVGELCVSCVCELCGCVGEFCGCVGELCG